MNNNAVLILKMQMGTVLKFALDDKNNVSG